VFSEMMTMEILRARVNENPGRYTPDVIDEFDLWSDNLPTLKRIAPQFGVAVVGFSSQAIADAKQLAKGLSLHTPVLDNGLTLGELLGSFLRATEKMRLKKRDKKKVRKSTARTHKAKCMGGNTVPIVYNQH
jgi:hypothetical protein